MRAALIVLFFCGCSGPMSSGAGDGGFLLPIPEPTGSTGGGFASAGGGAASAGGAPGDGGLVLSQKGVCTSAVTFPAEVGRACGAGSNQALCVVTSSSVCLNGTVCVWDQNAPSTNRAYCTVGCTIGDASTCPSGYECLAQGCSNGPATVCARRAVSMCTRVTEFGTGRLAMTSPIAALDAYAVGVAQGGMLRVFLMRGTTVVRDLGSVPDNGLTMQALGTFGREAWWSAPPRLLRVTEQGVETFTTPMLTEFSLAASDGAVVSFSGVDASRNPVVATWRAGVFTSAQRASVVTNRFAATVLGDGSLLGMCAIDQRRTALCATKDFLTATPIALPPGAQMPDRDWSIVGASARDFAVVTDDAVVRRFRDGAWGSDAFPSGDARAVFQDLGTERYLVRFGAVDGGAPPSSLYLETPGCWRKVQAGATVYSGSFASRHGYYSTGLQWCDVPLPR